jgi:hypothetical protein
MARDRSLPRFAPAGARRLSENKVRRILGGPWQVSELRTEGGEARVLFYPCGARAYYLTFQAGNHLGLQRISLTTPQSFRRRPAHPPSIAPGFAWRRIANAARSIRLQRIGCDRT